MYWYRNEKFSIWYLSKHYKGICIESKPSNNMKALLKKLKAIWFWPQNIRKELNFYKNYSKTIEFPHKGFQKNDLLSSKLSESIWFWPRLFDFTKNVKLPSQTSEKYLISAHFFENYWICIQNIGNLSYLYTDIRKVSYFYPKHAKRYFMFSQNI